MDVFAEKQSITMNKEKYQLVSNFQIVSDLYDAISSHNEQIS